jgi:cytidylate kinase
MQITITGKLGSGKSTICGMLAQRYNFEIFSTGDLHRGLAKKMGLDTIALNQLMAQDSHLDRMIDDEVIRISKSRPDDQIIFDSRLAWHFVEKSFKIFTTIDPLVAAKRVMSSPRGVEETYSDLNDVLAKLKIRAELEKTRFKDIYGVDYLDYNNFNIILDTTWLDPSSIADIIIKNYQSFKTNGQSQCGNILISPKSLYPTAPLVEPKVTGAEDYFASNPIKVIYKDNYHFVVDDNGSFSIALAAKLPYVHAVLAVNLDNNQIISNLDKNLLIEVEKKGDFNYFSRPNFFKH